MFFKKKLQQRFFSAIALGPLILAVVLYGGFPFLAMSGVVFMLSTVELFNMSKNVRFSTLHFLFGLLYISLCFFAFIALRLFDHKNGMYLCFSMVLAIWSSDIGAYFTGKLIEGPKMAPSISPRKTWAGLVGAILFPALLLWCLLLFAPWLSNLLRNELSVTLEDSAIIFIAGGGVGLIGQMGDLIISSFKRKAGVKDTGNVIPGHGGILDRIDSALLVSPYFLIASLYIFLNA